MMKFVIWFAHVTAALTGFVIASGVGVAVRKGGVMAPQPVLQRSVDQTRPQVCWIQR